MPVNLTVGLSVDEYLDRSFDPACELLGGETRPKPFGTGRHSKMRHRLLRLLEQIFDEGLAEFSRCCRCGRSGQDAQGACSTPARLTILSVSWSIH
jgi:hypothetical protein